MPPSCRKQKNQRRLLGTLEPIGLQTKHLLILSFLLFKDLFLCVQVSAEARGIHPLSWSYRELCKLPHTGSWSQALRCCGRTHCHLLSCLPTHSCQVFKIISMMSVVMRHHCLFTSKKNCHQVYRYLNDKAHNCM